jgi:hypothetical protein
MWKYFAAIVMLVAVVFAVSYVNSQSISGVNSTSRESQLPPSVSNDSVRPECVISPDCGTDGYTEYFCDWNYVARDYVTYACVNGGSQEAKCSVTAAREYADLCSKDMICTPGKSTCQPRSYCYDGVKDHGERGIDCGGPCKSCTKSDPCQNGSACPGVQVYCTSNASCGIPRWGVKYCGEDGSVYSDYMTFECVNPGQADSFCKDHREIWRTDYCGPFNKCIEGVCFDYRDPTAMHMPEYVCHPTDSCAGDGKIFTTCRGDWCFKVKEPLN